MTTTYRLGEDDLGAFLNALKTRGYTVVGPRVQQGAIRYAEIQDVTDLPRGWSDEQAPGRYRLKSSESPLFFGFAAPSAPLKEWFQPPREKLYSIRLAKEQMVVQSEHPPRRKLAIFGARACDLEGLRRLDEALLGAPHADQRYAARREGTLLIAAHCTSPADTCFCTSMKTGPRARQFDLALTEGLRGEEHLFLLEVGSDIGGEVLKDLAFVEASEEEVSWARGLVSGAAQQMQNRPNRQVDPEAARDDLRRNLEHPRWDQIAERCMACANCTASCPTCFCSSLEDDNTLDGSSAERFRRSDSCFNTDFSYVHGGAVRASLAARYRQWLTHKFSHWYDQFGTSGCVGCGRCISWCPVGIDVTEELAYFQSASGQRETES